MSISHSNDEEKIRRLYINYRKLMFKEAYAILKDHALAEDAVHNSFVKIINYIHKINEKNDASTRNYLVIICRNVAIDMQKRKLPLMNEHDNIEDISNEDASIEPNLLDIVINGESVAEISYAIEQLPSKYRDVIIMHYVKEHNIKEIAEILDISEENAKKRLYRARKKLLKYMNGMKYDEK